MLKSNYVEDIFLTFYQLMIRHGFALSKQDSNAAYNFQNLLSNGEKITKSQGNLILKILEKYKLIANQYNFDYANCIQTPEWRQEFRSLDLSKKITVEQQETGEKFVILKFPYNLKEIFDKEFPPENGYGIISSWDHERKVRVVPFNKINIIALNEFVKKYQFEMDDSFIESVSIVENIWNDQDQYIPHSIIFENKIILMNSNEYVDEYFEKHATGNLAQDVFLAKSMNFLLKIDRMPENTVEKISTSNCNKFWIKNFEDFFHLYKDINDKICILLDRNTVVQSWIEKFVENAEKNGVDRRDIRVCFRAPKEDTSDLNQWIKDNDLGGPVADGKIYIFHHKPAKWLFKDGINVKIIVTNGIYPETHSLTKDWMNSHPCVVYLSDIKPTPNKGTKIVEL